MSKRAGERWDRCGYGGQNAPRSRLGQEQVWGGRRLVHSHKLGNIFLIRKISHDCDDPRNENQSGPVRSYWGKTNLKRRKDIKFISQIGPLTRFIYLCLGQSRWIQKYKKSPTLKIPDARNIPQWIHPLRLFDQSPVNSRQWRGSSDPWAPSLWESLFIFLTFQPNLYFHRKFSAIWFSLTGPWPGINRLDSGSLKSGGD